MTGKTPLGDGDGLGGDEGARGHARPLGVEEDLEVVRSCGKLDRDDGDAGVLLIGLAVHEGRRVVRANSGAGGEFRAIGCVEDLHLEGLAAKFEFRRGTAGVNGDSRVGVHAPFDRLGDAIEIILDEDLLAGVEETNTTCDLLSKVGRRKIGGEERSRVCGEIENGAGALDGI